MRKLTLIVLLAILLLAMTVFPAFAIMDPVVPADDCSGRSVGGAAGPSVFDPEKGNRGPAPVHDTNENVLTDDCPPEALDSVLSS